MTGFIRACWSERLEPREPRDIRQTRFTYRTWSIATVGGATLLAIILAHVPSSTMSYQLGASETARRTATRQTSTRQTSTRQTSTRLAATKATATAATIDDEPPAAPTGISPYGNWEDRGMRPPVDPREAREDLTDLQRRQINAAYGGQDYRGWEHCVAGHPTFLRRHAFPSDTGRYFGYQVGGGTIFAGTGRDPDEGTFGWDYVNPLFPARVALGWSHRRVQGGTGAYATDHHKRGE